MLTLKNVYKSYNDNLILNDIDLQVSKGELCTVVGPSGSGKSTLLKLILGQEEQTSGSILINNKTVPVKAHIAEIPTLIIAVISILKNAERNKQAANP